LRRWKSGIIEQTTSSAWRWRCAGDSMNPQITQISQMEKRDNRTYSIIGAAMEVHRELGNGVLEAVYQEALALELKIQGIPFSKEVNFPISYKGQELSTTYRADFVCFDAVIVELKALGGLSGIDEAQLKGV